MLEEGFALLVIGRRGDEGDVHAAEAVDFVVVHFLENDLLFEAHGIVAVAVKLAGDAAEVSHTRKRDIHEPV